MEDMIVEYEGKFVASKLERWEKYMENYNLPAWDNIPNLGLYMEQVLVLLQQYLDYLPPELREEQFITAATINNYVRKKIMPVPVKKRYYRKHIAYLIIILTLKHSLSIALIQKLIPDNLTDAELEKFYVSFVNQHELASTYFVRQARILARPFFKEELTVEDATRRTNDLIITSAMIGGFSQLLSEKLLLMEEED
ncbi:MAG: DUF1836 domain-containing protein [Eubacterium sp.]|nr:DUF1836 domain-containing protein [Eubacterium sp.]